MEVIMDSGAPVDANPAVLSIGVDIIEVERLKRGAERYGQRFYDRFFTTREQEQCAGRAASLAGRFAVKEAVSKALGTGIGDVAWKEIEVLNDENGRPALTLHGAAARLAAERGLQLWSISLSHTATHAVGMATALGVLSGISYVNISEVVREEGVVPAGGEDNKRYEE
jgi:holo-[acyl-carrier protein] synthase